MTFMLRHRGVDHLDVPGQCFINEDSKTTRDKGIKDKCQTQNCSPIVDETGKRVHTASSSGYDSSKNQHVELS